MSAKIAEGRGRRFESCRVRQRFRRRGFQIRSERSARAFEADDAVGAVDPGDTVAGVAPGLSVGVAAHVVVGPEGPVPRGARRQPRPEDRLDVLERQKLGPPVAAFEVLLERGVLAHGGGRSVGGGTGAEDAGDMVNEGFCAVLEVRRH